MKRLTLDEAWRLCLKQWKWIVREWKESKGETSIETLKKRWMKKYYPSSNIWGNCFFCEYDSQHKDRCISCPGKKIHKRFHCVNVTYDFYDKPERFLKELLRLNRIRNAKKKKV